MQIVSFNRITREVVITNLPHTQIVAERTPQWLNVTAETSVTIGDCREVITEMFGGE